MAPLVGRRRHFDARRHRERCYRSRRFVAVIKAPTTRDGSSRTVRDATEARVWHTLDAGAVARHFDVDPDSGLAPEIAAERLARFGPNSLPDPAKRRIWQMVAAQFRDFMIAILVAAAIVSGFVGAPRDSIAIVVIVVLNAVIGVIQEFRAERALAALNALAAPVARAHRAGRVAVVPAAELVPGDVVAVEAGDLVPADLRLVDAEALEADESALTGESSPVAKDTQALTETSLGVADRTNLVFRGTLVTHGRARGIVVSTGTSTELGRIAAMLGDTRDLSTPLKRRLTRFGTVLGIAILAIAAVIFVAGLWRGEPPALMFLTAVSLAVAAIPEALPAVVTIALALGARRMSTRNALVRRLPAVETLGSVTYICADKTGTMTRNEMQLARVVTAPVRPSNLDQAAELELTPWLGRALALNNDVEFDDDGGCVGDPTEVALANAALAHGYVRSALEADFPRVGEQPFDSHTKRMTTVHASGRGFVGIVKGAPEAVIPDCTCWSDDAGPVAVADALAISDALAREGYRVLAVAMRAQETPEPAATGGLELLGLCALIDPPRDGVADAVRDARAAGIVPVMITGDHPETARAIAREVGIVDETSELLTGEALESLSDEALGEVVTSVRVYARMNPAQKIRIVEALATRGEIVAMTGDGVNDAPALKRADIGVAMGRKGTDVAREAADMVLLDDDFSTIVSAVREGRRIFDNIRKFVRYTMTSNSGEIWTLFLAPFLGMPLPLLPIQILWINLITDGLPGLALSAEPAERGIMSRPPRPPTEGMFAHGMGRYVIGIGLLIGALALSGQAWALARGSEHWRTVVFTILTFSQLAQALSVRTEREALWRAGPGGNPTLLAAIAGSVALQLGIVYLPPLQPIFGTTPLPALELVVCCVLPMLVVVAAEGVKATARRSDRHPPLDVR